jgi:hypothetical protein
VTTSTNSPDDIETFQLMQLKAAARLEGVGMRHSSGRSAKREAIRRLGLPLRSSIDDVIGALNREIDRRIQAKRKADIEALRGSQQ